MSARSSVSVRLLAVAAMVCGARSQPQQLRDAGAEHEISTDMMDPSTIEIAPGVKMPFVSDGIILDAKANHTGEVKGLDLFFRLGGRGVDTAWSYHNQPLVGLAVREASVPRNEIFLTTKIECMGTAEAAYAAIERDLRCGWSHSPAPLNSCPAPALCFATEEHLNLTRAGTVCAAAVAFVGAQPARAEAD
jgi:hypothetical protein